jgi:methylenetetrahydrofolate reductase (NADPH)
MKELLPLKPAYVSVTYGAGGSTRENTHELVARIHGDGLPVVAHLTCQGSSREEIDEILDRYHREGIHNILALRGDVPQADANGAPSFEYAADLVAHIKARYPHFGVGVAGFPEGHPVTPNRLKEMDFLKAKVDAGADYIVTQLFFDNRDFLDFRDRCTLAGITVPVIAGLMPITSVKGMERMAELSGGSRFPADLMRRLRRAVNNNEGRWGVYGGAGEQYGEGHRGGVPGGRALDHRADQQPVKPRGGGDSPVHPEPFECIDPDHGRTWGWAVIR